MAIANQKLRDHETTRRIRYMIHQIGETDSTMNRVVDRVRSALRDRVRDSLRGDAVSKPISGASWKGDRLTFSFHKDTVTTPWWDAFEEFWSRLGFVYGWQHAYEERGLDRHGLVFPIIRHNAIVFAWHCEWCITWYRIAVQYQIEHVMWGGAL